MIKFFPKQKIDWSLLAEAERYYNQEGFESIETPYIVPLQYSEYTKPHSDDSFTLNHGFFKNNTYELVGSAEQGFIFLLMNNYFQKNDQYLSITPCFRVDSYDETHQPWFIKLELFHYDSDIHSLYRIINIAKDFFENQLSNTIQIVKTDLESFDLFYKEIELGSYGIRHVENNSFIYGTGLALPRFSQVKNLNHHE